MEEEIDVDLVLRHAPETVNLLKVLSHQTRLLVLCCLSSGEKSVSELTEILGIEQSNVSQHLGCLRQKNIVKTRREKSKIFYSLAEHPALELLRVLSRIVEH